MHNAAQHLLMFPDRVAEAGKLFQMARDIGAAHGFFSVECSACQGLGRIATMEGRLEEAVDLLRHALAASTLNEDEDANYELGCLDSLTAALLKMKAVDEVADLVPRYRELAQEDSRKVGRLCSAELHSLLVSAQLFQARGETRAAALEVQALLALMCENERAVQGMPGQVSSILRDAASLVEGLHPSGADDEALVASVAAELAQYEV